MALYQHCIGSILGASYTIPRQYPYCVQTTFGQYTTYTVALYQHCIVSILISYIRYIRYWAVYTYTVYTILGQYPYCVQTIITQYWANTCMYRKRIPIQYRANFTLFPGLRRLKIPKIWRRALVVAIPKPGKPVGDPKSYRPISLLCVSYKILERLIYARVEPLIDPLLSKEQLGSDARSQP